MRIFNYGPNHQVEKWGHKSVMLMREFAPNQFDGQCPNGGAPATVVLIPADAVAAERI